MALVAWVLLHPRVAVEIFSAARPCPGRSFRLVWIRMFRIAFMGMTPGWMAR